MPGAMRTALRCAVSILLAVVVLAGCGAADDAPPDPTATVAVEATPTVLVPTQPPDVVLGEVVWTTAVAEGTGAPVDTLTTLPNDAGRIVAAVPVETLPAGITLQARWSIDGDPLPALDPAPLVVEEGRQDAWVSWSLSWTSDQPWPIGTLGIQIEVNGEPRLSDEIIIVRAQGQE